MSAEMALARELRPDDDERAVLGGILLMNEALADVRDVLAPADFSVDSRRVVYEAMLALGERSHAIDILTLCEELTSRGMMTLAGGMPGLAALDANVPMTANLLRYAEKVRDRARRRRMLAAGQRVQELARDLERPTAEVLGDAEALVLAVADAANTGRVETIGRVLKDEVFPSFAARFERQSSVTGLATGLDALDGMTAGLQAGDLVIVGGRPSMGKTSLAMQVATHTALASAPALVFSLEMGRASLIERCVSSESRVDAQRIRTGKFEDADWPKMARACDRLFKAPLVVNDTARTVAEMRGFARRTRRELGGLTIVVIDYLQLMGGASDSDNREQEIAAISRGLKALARELGCPVMALSQLNRSLEKRTDKRPQMSDLRESGALEQDADLIVFVYRDEVYDKESKDKGIAEIIIAKQRNGPIGTVRTAFLNSLTRFENLAEDQKVWG